MSSYKLTRIAPTPSGFLHIGNALSFIITAALAKKHDLKILLRIDDLDRERYKAKYVQDIFDTLDFLEIPFHEGPKTLKDFEANHTQLQRIPQYNAALEQLKKAGVLFACNCSRKKVAVMHPSGFYTGLCKTKKLSFKSPENSWRMNTPIQEEIPIKTLEEGVVSGKIPGILRDFIVRKKDEMPTYQLTSVVDDIQAGVDFIVRGKDLWGSSLAQIHLSRCLAENSFTQNTFHHHNLITGPNNQKLSKSAGATSIQFLRKSGKKSSEIYQMIGESMGIEKKISRLEDFSDLV
jgi:glutamyl/glutaminyl-tRNA synthetase